MVRSKLSGRKNWSLGNGKRISSRDEEKSDEIVQELKHASDISSIISRRGCANTTRAGISGGNM